MMPFVPVTSGFAFMSAVAHLIVLLQWNHYVADLRKGKNLYRWAEYSVSSSLMILLIAELFGIYDVITLTAIVGCNAAMCGFGALHEIMNAKRAPEDVSWLAFWMGSAVGAVPWACILAYIGASPSVGSIPAFVWVILVVYAFFFNTFPINMYFQYRRTGWWSDAYWQHENGGYLFGEKVCRSVRASAPVGQLCW